MRAITRYSQTGDKMKKALAVFGLSLFLVTTFVGKGQAQMIEKGKTVKFDYTLTVDGKVMDTSSGKQPLEYVQGSGQIIPGLESQMTGMKAGEEKTVKVAAADAYGPVLPEGIQEFPKSFFPADLQLTVGMVVPLQNESGQTFPATVKEIKADKVVLDLNHPLAGKDLTFDIRIVEVK